MKTNKHIILYTISLISYDKFLLESNILSLLFEIKSKLNFIKLDHSNLLPISSKRTCLLRSAFVDSSSKEHLEIKKYKFFIVIKLLKKKNIFILTNIVKNILKHQDLHIKYKKVFLK